MENFLPIFPVPFAEERANRDRNSSKCYDYEERESRISSLEHLGPSFNFFGDRGRAERVILSLRLAVGCTGITAGQFIVITVDRHEYRSGAPGYSREAIEPRDLSPPFRFPPAVATRRLAHTHTRTHGRQALTLELRGPYLHRNNYCRVGQDASAPQPSPPPCLRS